jgi:IclR family pca regulon transcriptional regulator
MSSDNPSALPVQHDLQRIAGRYKGDPDFMLSLARGLQVLLAFSERKTPLSVSEIALKTALDRAVVRRCIYTLQALGMVHRNGNRYVLQTNVLSLGHAYFSSAQLITAAQPLLDALSDAIHTNCALAVLSGSDVVYLVRSQSRRLTQHSLGMGSRLPAHCTSLGRVLLAHLPTEELALYLDSLDLPPLTPFTVTDKRQLADLLEAAGREGYAVVDREVELDLVGIAIPVRLPGASPLLSLSVTVSPRYTAAAEMKTRYLRAMQDTARQLETLQSGAPP